MITDESYFVWLCKYILNNPVKAGLVKQAEEWQYSSAREYFDSATLDLTDKDEILNRFNSINEFVSFVKTEKVKFDYSLFF